MTTKRSSVAERRLGELPGLRELLEELRLYADLDAELADCQPPKHFTPTPAAKLQRAGVHFNIDEVRRFLVFARKLRHIKGKWAGRPFVPDLWQILFIVGPLFGWRQADGNRLYNTAYIEVPRKNGKSTLCAAIDLYLLMADSNLEAGRLAEAGAEVYTAAATTRQAKEVFRPAEEMARRSPAIAKRVGIKRDEAIYYERTASRLEVVSGAPQKAEEKMGLNPSGATIDELHVHKSRALIDTIDSGTGAREQPLIVIITTAGLDDPGSIYTEKRDYAEKVADGKLEDESWLVAIYTVDTNADPYSEKTWAAANPGLGKSVQLAYLRRKAREARNSPAALNTFLRLHLNVRTGQVTRWLPLDKWDLSGAFVSKTYEELRGRVGYGGLDLSSAVDLTAVAIVLPRCETDGQGEDVEVLDVLLRAWTPADTLAARAERDRAPYLKWVEDGLLRTCPGNVIDYDEIEAEIFLLAEHLDLQRLHFDRWGSKQILQHLRDGEVNVFEMGQGYASMSPALKETEKLTLERRLRHAGNPLLRWSVGSLAIRQDSAGNIKPDREASTGRIDPFVALAMAVDAWSRSEDPGESVYEERGLATA